MQKFKNYGVIPEIRETDWLGGTIPYEVRNDSGDWTAFVPKPENQYSNQADSMACVSFSFLNVLETQIKFMTGQDVDFSDRFLAKVSGTTIHGNTLGAVADAYRQYGCPLETDWPKPDGFTWDEFYATIPQDVYNKAIKYNISYEWVETSVDSLQLNLKQSPLQLVIPGHAICGIYEQSDIFKYFDTYAPYIKSLANPPLWAMKIVLNNMFQLVQVAGSPEVWLIKDNKKTHIYNQGALLAISDFSHISPITQVALDAMPDSGLELATLVKE